MNDIDLISEHKFEETTPEQKIAVKSKLAEWKLDFNANIAQEIRPAQSFDGATLSYGLTLPCTSEPKNETKQLLVLINSNREQIPADAEHLIIHNLKLTGYPVIKPRWSRDSIKRFLDGEYPQDKRLAFDEIANAFSEFIDFGDYRRNILQASWILGTYYHQIFNSYPYQSFFGNKKSGKSKALNLIQLLAFNGRFELNPTDATLFRTTNDFCPTTCFDEFEWLNDEKKNLIYQILRSAYKKTGVVPRTERVSIKGVSETFRVIDYPIYSPKAFAGTFELPAFEDRVIRNTLQHTTDQKIKNNEPNPHDSLWLKIRDDCYQFALSYANEINQLYNAFEPPEGFDSRTLELWKPLFVTAKFVDETYFNQLLDLAQEIERERSTETHDTEEYALIEALDLMIRKESIDQLNPRENYSINDIKGYLQNVNADLYDWDDPKQQRSIHTKIGRALKRSNLKGNRVGSGMIYKITRENIDDLKERLGLKKTTGNVSCVS